MVLFLPSQLRTFTNAVHLRALAEPNTRPVAIQKLLRQITEQARARHGVLLLDRKWLAK
jgi:hypothetical protein